MKRSWTLSLLALPLAALLVAPVAADVKTREHSQVKFEGMLGRAFNLFGGKAAREGIVSTTAVKGNRKSSVNDNNGQIIDLAEEKVYDLDFKKKEYRVTTFEEMRRRIQEEREKAEKQAREAEKEEKEEAQPNEPRKEWEFDFKADETGQKKQLAGYDTRQVIMTVTAREKGKTLEEGGGFVMTADSWLGPEIASLKELAAFDQKYMEKLYGAEAMALAGQQMAMALAMYPMLKQASDRLAKEGNKLKGTPLATTTMFEVVKSKAQLEAANSQQSSGGGGGLGGMLARKMAKKDPPKPRSTIFTIQHEYQEVGTSVGAELDIPAGFKEKK
jgi:hypothetical protein